MVWWLRELLSTTTTTIWVGVIPRMSTVNVGGKKGMQLLMGNMEYGISDTMLESMDAEDERNGCCGCDYACIMGWLGWAF